MRDGVSGEGHQAARGRLVGLSVRSVQMLGRLAAKEYFEDEPNPPKIFELFAQPK
jgi:hypothetical protein